MIKYIKRYLFARAICRKYKLKLTIRLNSSEVAYYWHDKRIELSLFSRFFHASFLHELSHHFDATQSKLYTSSPYDNRSVRCVSWQRLGRYGEGKEETYRNQLYREARANRYSLRMLKVLGLYTKSDLGWLCYCMNSYIAAIPETLNNKLILADIDYKLRKYLLY